MICNEFYLKMKTICFYNVMEYILHAVKVEKFQNNTRDISHVAPLRDTVNTVEANERSRSFKFFQFF